MCYTAGDGQVRDAGLLFVRSLHAHPQPHTVVTEAPVMSGSPRAGLAVSVGARRDGGFVMNEEWRPCPIFPECYEVSNLGNVRRTLKRRRYPAYGLLVQVPNHKGYPQVLLSHAPDRPKTRMVHRLVAIAFLGYGPEGSECNHKDGVKTNNRVENLEWVTPKENSQHAVRLGLMPGLLGDRNGARKNPKSRLPGAHVSAKLNWPAVDRIRALVAQGIGQRQMSREYGVDIHTIGRVIRHETWKEEYRDVVYVSAAARRKANGERPLGDALPVLTGILSEGW